MSEPSEDNEIEEAEELEEPVENEENVNLDSEDEDELPMFCNDENKKLY